MKSPATALIASGFLLFSSAVLADDTRRESPSSGFYVGLDVGRSTLTARQYFNGGRTSGNDTGYKLRFGYQFFRYVALEVGYADFGEFSTEDYSYCALPDLCELNFRSKTTGALANVVGSWPFAERWALNGRFGATRSRVSTTEQGPVMRNRSSDSNTGVTYGVGLSYNVNPHMTFGVDWARFDQYRLGRSIAGDIAVTEMGSPTLTSLGVSYRF